MLFVGFKKEAGQTRDARTATAKKYAPALAVVAKEFEERFRKPLGLPTQGSGTYIWIFEAPGDYDAFVEGKRFYGKSTGLRGCFDQRSGWCFLGVNADAARAGELPRNLCHNAVHQLQWRYSKDPKRGRMFDEWNGVWFSVGFAAWLGGGVDFNDGQPKFTGIDPRRKAQLRVMAENGVPWILLRDLTQIQSWDGLERWITDDWWPAINNDEQVPEETTDMIRTAGLGNFAVQTFQAQAWGLAHFLAEKHPEKYRDLLMTALRGKRKPKKYQGSGFSRWPNTYTAFAEIFGLKSDADWAAMDKKYAAHLKQLAK